MAIMPCKNYAHHCAQLCNVMHICAHKVHNLWTSHVHYIMHIVQVPQFISIQIEVGIKSFSAVSLASWFCVNMGWHAWIRLFHQWIINKCVGCVMVCVRCDIVHACTCSAMPSFWCYPPSTPPCPHGQVGCFMVFKLCTLCHFMHKIMHKIMHLLCKIMHLWLCFMHNYARGPYLCTALWQIMHIMSLVMP